MTPTLNPLTATPEEVRAEIAIYDGWVWVMKAGGDWCRWMDAPGSVGNAPADMSLPPSGNPFHNIPHYTTSLDAIAPVEARAMDQVGQEEYAKALFTVTYPERGAKIGMPSDHIEAAEIYVMKTKDGESDRFSRFDLLLFSAATAEQRARAVLLAIKEKK